ncbi:MAG TPA: Smr/MutS family protein, partial [Candidatus Limnocylindrales bacterium]|nr:Smr/MutS family protein [Candidatus Limnocylindrales bacterium]
IVLLGARHPGLTGHVVPIDVRLGDGYTALVITGPNTGGKTVALRTIGLLTLMHQAGLQVPAAAGSRLSILADVFADIGDEQSIAQSLSTFSGHLRSIVRIVEAAGPRSLVLLDELGAGTDPTEGSALAQALLDGFVEAGALVVATTHYAELKTYAHNHPAVRNASVEFDLETLSPTYRLSIGLPGTSQAFAIAARLGLPAELVEDARSRLSRAQLEFESTLAAIKEAREAADAATERARLAEERAAEARHGAEVERARARRERDDAFTSAHEEAERALAALRAEIREARERLGRETLTESRLDEVEAGLERRLAAIAPPVRRGAATGAQTRAGGSETPAAPAWRVGMRARTRAGGWDGRIRAIERGRATLEAGDLRVTVPLADLEPAPAQPATARPDSRGRQGSAASAGERGAPLHGRRGDFGTAAAGQGQRVGGRVTAAPASVPSSLDLRGARLDEALEALDAYLDRASAAGVPRATIVHGHGSGALRDAVRTVLAGHPLVRSWRPGGRGEGGEGASIVEL